MLIEAVMREKSDLENITVLWIVRGHKSRLEKVCIHIKTTEQVACTLLCQSLCAVAGTTWKNVFCKIPTCCTVESDTIVFFSQ